VIQAIEGMGEDAAGEGFSEPVSPRARCLCGKARYATEGEARRAVKRMRCRGRDRSYEGVLHPYMCPERKGIWHVGHTDE
jgi:hypothetical protein